MAITKPAGPISVRQPGQIAGLRMLKRNKRFVFDRLFRAANPITVGRTRQSDMQLRHDTVSRRHCSIERSPDGEYIIVDRGSTNGIYVADCGAYGEYRRVTRCILKMGMHIRLGDVTITPVDAAGEAPVFVKRTSEFLLRIIRLYGSFREAANHVKPSRETLRLFYNNKFGPKKHRKGTPRSRRRRRR